LGFPPAIGTDPETQTAEIGSTVVLRAPAAGSAPLKYQWSLDGEPRTITTNSIYELAGAGQWYFDVTTPLSDQGFYRAWQTNTPGQPASLSLALVPALTITGAVGGSVRIDAINTFGPTDAWVTLDTVTLTNTSQFYFDTSAVGQPERLWRIVPLP
jgi:hypothetical protein